MPLTSPSLIVILLLAADAQTGGGPGAPAWLTPVLVALIAAIFGVVGKGTFENWQQKRERLTQADSLKTTTFVDSADDVITWWKDVVAQATASAKAAQEEAGRLSVQLEKAVRDAERAKDNEARVKKQLTQKTEQLRQMTARVDLCTRELEQLRREVNGWNGDTP